MDKKRVLIVDDSAFMRKLISEFLSTHPKLEVAGTARNGKDALEKALRLQPDVITMDVEMPEMNGLEALECMMKKHPVPVVMLSSLTKEGASQTLAAMDKGAVDFVAKPSGTISLDLHKIKAELITKVLAASQVNIRSIQPSVRPYIQKKVFTQLGAGMNTINLRDKGLDIKLKEADKKIVLIGTSTGGPRALQQVLTNLPADLQAPVLVVQHMPRGFTKSLAERLNSLAAIHIKEAENGEILQKGVAYIAPGDCHLSIEKVGVYLAAKLDQSPPVNGHRPSVDYLFESVSKLLDYHKLAIIMTGMGSDGVTGLIKLKENGNVRIIAESKESCVVFGMPKAAIATRLVDEVQPVDQIAEAILKYLL
ncbi:MAG TPA: chemotaxis response regulator protein-glutamate methylesterase [Chondromyces sp.]|nr:chemotaxis response regulator protein-glutamate methylesterase [Chondromyces sp.]